MTAYGPQKTIRPRHSLQTVKAPKVSNFLRRSGLVLIGQGGQAASSFILTVAVARAVGPAIRGEFVLLTLVPQLGGYIVTLGLPGAVLRAAAAERDKRPLLLTISAVASLCAGILLTALTPVLMSAAGSSTPPVGVVFLGTTSLVWVIFAAWFAFGCEQFVLAGVLRTAPILGAALVIAGLRASGHSSLASLYLPWAGLHFLAATASATYLFRQYPWAWPPRAQVWVWVHYGLRYSIVQILDLVTLRFDQIILGVLGATTTVGLYSIGVSLSEGILLVTTAVGLVVFLDSARGEASAYFRRRLITTVVASSVAAALLAVITEPLVSVLFGTRYLGATQLTRILVIGTPGLVILRMTTNRLAGLGRPGTASVYVLITFTVTTGLDLLLIPSHGATGAAWASAIGYNVGGAGALVTMRWIDQHLPYQRDIVEVSQNSQPATSLLDPSDDAL